MTPWNPFEEEAPGPEQLHVAGVDLRKGSRVRLWPCGRADIMDLALEGMTATVVGIEQDYEDRFYLAVTVDDDPGKDFGAQHKPAHRFFFRPEEVEPLDQE
jgi:hypothetical protein